MGGNIIVVDRRWLRRGWLANGLGVISLFVLRHLMLKHLIEGELFEQIFHQTGFQIDSQHVTFFGRCPTCQEEVET